MNSNSEKHVAEHFSSLDLRVRSLWAKSGDGYGHGLLAHMLDVAASAGLLLKREPGATHDWLARAFGLPPKSVGRWIAALAGLHDFGKSIPGFQDKWPEGKARDESAGLEFAPASLGISDHAGAGAALLKEFLSLLGLTPTCTRGILQALSAHHGYNLGIREARKPDPRVECPAWQTTRKVLFDTYWSILAPEGIPSADELSLASVEWLAGLTSVADWIASNQEWFPLGERDDSLMCHFEKAKKCATDAFGQIGWPDYRPLLASTPDTNQLIQRILDHPTIRPRPLQIAGDRLLLDARGPSLLLVEAPMGEGKTELGFIAHLRLQAANQHRGMYIALPTRATGNAIFDRTISFMRAFSDDEHLDIQLIHAGALLDERVQHLREMWGEPGDSINSSAWFSQRRRGLLSPYGVGTVDQALFATLNVKHHFVRLWGLSNRVVILDEVHAYDTYTSGLIEALLRWLKKLGCSVVVMSATLPLRRRDEFLRAWGVSPEKVTASSYPRLVLADDLGVHSATCASRPLPPIHVVAIDETVESLATRALECVSQGGCGAVIVNTVDRAQELYRLLRSSLNEGLTLFHARFPANERAAIEAAVLATFGKGANRPTQALLIATQVAEQSLDIDFDFLLTDLAPVDLVLQRAGRLHRHERTRPEAHAKARLFVAGLSAERLPDFKETRWGFVYDPYILGRTWAFLSQESALHLPADIDRLVQTVYGESPLPEHLPKEAVDFIEHTAHGRHMASVQVERQLAVNAAIDPIEEPQNAYLGKPRGNEAGDGLGISNRTRLGDDGIALVPVHLVDGGWSPYPGGVPFDPDQPVSDEVAKVLFMRQMTLSRKDVVQHIAAQVSPVSFSQHPLLRYLRPLVFEDGTVSIGSLRLHLDKELGLVYEKNAPLSQSEDEA